MIHPVFANIFGMIDNPIGIVIVGGLVLLLFGGNKMAGFGKSLGEGLKEFKKATKELHDEPAETAAPQPAASSSPTVSDPYHPGSNAPAPVSSTSELETVNRS